jgi:hypothetical protein
MKGAYKIPIKLNAVTLSIAEAPSKRRGPEYWKENNNEEVVLVEEPVERLNKNEKILFSSSSSANLGATIDKTKGLSEKFEEYYKTLYNKKKFNMVLQDSRKGR